MSARVRDGLDKDDFDFELHLEKDYLGMESTDLMIEGNGVHTDGAFTFKAPVSLARVRFALGNKEHSELGFDQLVYEEKEFTFDISAQDLQVDGVELSDDDKALIVARVQ